MEILRDFKQISDKTSAILNVEIKDVPILDYLDKLILKELAKGAKKGLKPQEVTPLAELIFQLNDYVPALSNYIKLFLYSENFQAVVAFMEKLFVAHVGLNIYTSKNREYSHKERFFDRFIEVVKNCDIDTQEILPFLFTIVEDEDKTNISYWLAPALEYLQNVFRENAEEVKEFVNLNPSHKNTYYTLGLEFNTQKTIGEIFNLEDSTISEAVFAKMLKHYYTDTMAFFDKNLPKSGDKKFHYVKILASIENPEVVARLEDLYEEETNEEIKSFIKSKLGIADKANLGVSPKHFETMALKKVERVQERTLGIPFEKMPLKFSTGEECSPVVKTYLIEIFKAEKDLLNLYGLESVQSLFDENDLNQFVGKLFEVLKTFQDIKEAKWAIRMISLLSSGKLEEDVYDFIYDLFAMGRIKEAKYFLSCIIYSKKSKVIGLLSRLIDTENVGFIDVKDEFINLYATIAVKNVVDVQDMLSSDEISEEAIKNQKQSLYNSFIIGRGYTQDQFEAMFIHKKVFNYLAQKLVFGEYKQNRVLSLFVLDGVNIKFIAGNHCEDKDVIIKIAHSLDLDERFEGVKDYFKDPTFNQFETPVFAVKENEKTLTKVSNMQGILVNSVKFISNMQDYNFVKNISNETESVNELIHISSRLNLLAEVSFESPVSTLTSTASIGPIRFYKLNQCLKNGSVYIINKANVLAIGSIEPRYYNYVVGAVAKSLKN